MIVIYLSNFIALIWDLCLESLLENSLTAFLNSMVASNFLKALFESFQLFKDF